MGFKGPRNMTVLLPGMTEDDQRVKISSCDTTQQGLLDSWKTKVSQINANIYQINRSTDGINGLLQKFNISFSLLLFFRLEYGQRCGIT